VRRLFDEYRKYQFKVCENSDRLKFELNMLRDSGIPDDSFEVYTYQEGARNGDVVFVFPIQVDAITSLPEKFLTGHTVGDFAKLKIKFTQFGDGKVHADLELTPFLNKLFNGKNTRMPTPRMECLLSEYVPAIRVMINEEVTAVGDAYKFKRDFFTALIASFPDGNLLDFDPNEFSTAAFELIHADFVFIFSVQLGVGPKSAMTLKFHFRSVYHEKETAVGSKKIYQPFTVGYALEPKSNTTVEQMIKKLEEAIELRIPDFKRKCCLEGK